MESSKNNNNNTMNTAQRFWLLFTNATMMIGWARVLRIIYRKQNLLWDEVQSQAEQDTTVCSQLLIPNLLLALCLSFLELVNALMGATRSKPLPVLLFSMVRFGTEQVLVVNRLLPCACWQHLWTVFCWSIGDTIRFGCFVLDLMVPGGRVARAVRYTVGPILFPLGAGGEMLMVIAAGKYSDRSVLFYAAAALWPLGFYPLFTQLLRQRRKFFREHFGKGQEAKIKAV